MNIKRTIEIEVDVAPRRNGPEFDEYCRRYGFDPLNSTRRAWCSSFGTYFRGALGVAYNDDVEPFLYYGNEEEQEEYREWNNQEMKKALERNGMDTDGL